MFFNVVCVQALYSIIDDYEPLSRQSIGATHLMMLDKSKNEVYTSQREVSQSICVFVKSFLLTHRTWPIVGTQIKQLARHWGIPILLLLHLYGDSAFIVWNMHIYVNN